MENTSSITIFFPNLTKPTSNTIVTLIIPTSVSYNPITDTDFFHGPFTITIQFSLTHFFFPFNISTNGQLLVLLLLILFSSSIHVKRIGASRCQVSTFGHKGPLLLKLNQDVCKVQTNPTTSYL